MSVKTFFATTLPMILLAACLVTAGLHFSGVIDLKQVGDKIKAAVAPKENLMEAPQLPPLPDGTVGESYFAEFDPQLLIQGKEIPSARFEFTLFDPDEEPMPPGLSLSKDGKVTGVPTKAGKYTLGICIEELTEQEGKCYDGYITINPKPEPPVAVITGNFSGPFEFTDNVGNPLFRDTGILNLRLSQDGNVISGVYAFTQIKMEQLQSLDQVKFGTTAPDFSKSVSGELSGARIEFTDGWIRFSGTFSSNQLRLNFESCEFNGCCKNPDNEGVKGEASPSNSPGVPDVPAPVYDCESGIKGTATLNRVI